MSIQLNGEHFSAHRRKVIDLLKAKCKSGEKFYNRNIVKTE